MLITSRSYSNQLLPKYNIIIQIQTFEIIWSYNIRFTTTNKTRYTRYKQNYLFVGNKYKCIRYCLDSLFSPFLRVSLNFYFHLFNRRSLSVSWQRTPIHIYSLTVYAFIVHTEWIYEFDINTNNELEWIWFLVTSSTLLSYRLL